MGSTGLIVLVAVLVAATAFGLWRKHTDGNFKTAKVQHQESAAGRLTATDIGAPLGADATLVEFSSSFCAPCRATKQVLTKVAGDIPGVEFVEIDAEINLEMTRRLAILRTPTVLILDGAGNIAHRASGQPRYADVIAALGAATDPAIDRSNKAT